MTLRLNGSTSGYSELTAPAVAGHITLALPSGNGTANQLLKNSGTAGALAFATATEDSSGDFAFNSGYGSAATAYGCRAWVNFDGSTTTPTIRASGNVSSVTRNGTGDYTLSFTTALPDANYSLLGGGGWTQGTLGNNTVVKTCIQEGYTQLTTAVRVRSFTAANTSADPATVTISIFR